ncbi:amino acid adenylation domain-containing protein [Variovorax sp. YR752]|uniref:non-ribosomal peptide synthetase n=1 Tax=Variovorax sp. YR752 TaxID=1884383 RepID=UPI003137F0AF
MNIGALIEQLEAQGFEFWHEGNRLRFRGPRGGLDAAQRAALSAGRDEAIAWMRERERRQVVHAPLSYGQRSLWLVHQEHPESAAYNVAFVVSVRSTIDRSALTSALQALNDRHAVLRTCYALEAGRPMQHIAGEATVALDWVALPSCDDTTLRRSVEADYRRPFDLERGPVWRTSVFSRGDDDHVLMICAHHIAVDGWSLLLMLDELRQFYAEQTGGAAVALQRPEQTYADYVRWQAAMLDSEPGQRLAERWMARLAAPRAELELPADHPRPARKSTRGATLDFHLEPALSDRLQQLARDEGTTLFVILLAAFKVLLYRYTGTDDVIVGTPTLGRDQGAFDRTLGHFVNPVPLRSRLSAGQSFRDLARQVRQTLLDALDDQEYPLALMVETLHPVRDPSRSPLFETLFVLQRFEQFRDLNELLSAGPAAGFSDFGGLRVRPWPLQQQEGQFDLGLGLVEREGRLGGAIKYNADLFDEGTVAALAAHYGELLRSITADPAQAIGQLRMLGSAEREALIAGAGRDLEPGPAQTLHARFEAQVALRPLATALSCDGERLDYAELNRRANRVAHRLRTMGASRGTIVALFAERSIELVTGLLGILKAGAAYLPIDLSYPADRVAFMLQDAAAPVIVTQRALLERLPAHGAAVLCLDDSSLGSAPDGNPEPSCGPDDLIYVIYTSGSTGQPKGTLLTHRAVDRLMSATQPWYGFGPDDVWTLFHSVAFDFSVWEIWGALVYGGRLVVVPYLVSRSPQSFLELLHDEGVTVLNQTPSAFRQLVQADVAAGTARETQLRHVIFGGEALELQSLRPWFDRHGDVRPLLVNMYGITETCVHVTYRPIRAADLERGMGSVIGEPIPDLRVHVLDAAREPMPVGVVGEMYVGGPGLALGYLNRPELTAERFVADPFRPGERLYRTGDLARRRRDGELEYIGRIDLQVKIRGFRIELGEIESALSRHEHVCQAAVVARDDDSGVRQLVAYVVTDRGASVPAAQLRERLRETLPDYMVPAAFVFLDTLPLTSNNKVDVRALPAPVPGVASAAASATEPRNVLEFQLLALWRQVLGNDQLGVHDNFFDHGGHSLVAVELLSRIEQVYGRKLPLATLFQAPAVAQLAELLSRSDWQASWRSLVAINPVGTATPMFLVPGVGGNVLMFGKLAKLLGNDQPVYGLQARGLDGKEEPFRSIAEMAGSYVDEIRSARPHGPYLIGGTCTGGVIAYEVAQRLVAQGEQVQLALLETWPPVVARAQSSPMRWIWPIKYLALKLLGYLREMAGMNWRRWPEFVRAKLRTGRGLLDVGLKGTLEGSDYYIEKVVSATLHAVANYEPRAYPGELLNVIAIERPLPPGAVDLRREWEKLAQGESEAAMVPAEDSGRLFISPHVEAVAALLRARVGRLGQPRQVGTSG